MLFCTIVGGGANTKAFAAEDDAAVRLNEDDDVVVGDDHDGGVNSKGLPVACVESLDALSPTCAIANSVGCSNSFEPGPVFKIGRVNFINEAVSLLKTSAG